MSRRRRLFAALGGLVLLAVAGAWLALRLASARTQLTAARADVAALQRDLVGGEVARADGRLAQAQRRTGAARAELADPVVAAAARVPYVGRTVTAVRRLAHVVDDTTRQVLPDLVAAARSLDPARLRVRGDTVDVGALESAQAPLRRAAGRTAELHRRAAAVPTAGVVTVVRRAHADLTLELGSLDATLAEAATSVRLAPLLLGTDRPRRYFLAFQTPAEARGSGGLIGAFGIVEAERGRIRLVRVESNTALRPAPGPVSGLPDDFVARYRRFSSDSFWLNANMSPHFPSTVRVLSGLYRATEGVALDGVVALDPITLSYVLRATGPARLPDGRVLAAESVADLLLRDAYAELPGNAERDRFFRAVAGAAFERLTSGAGQPRALLDALGRAVRERRLLFGATDPALQRALESLPISGVVPDAPGPYLQTVVNNAAGTKLDYYLDRSVHYELVERPGGAGEATIEVTLTNRAPASGLPAYVVARPDIPPGARRPPAGSHRVHLSVYVGRGAGLRSAAVRHGTDGTFVPTTVEAQRERGHAVFATFLDLAPGRAVTLRLLVSEPRFAHRVTVRQQPIVRPELVHLRTRGTDGALRTSRVES